MKALARATNALLRRVRVKTVAPAAPEPVYSESRPAVGFFSTLTAEQKKRALAYQGSESLGDPAFRTNATHC
jgi:hypothetical protein